MSLTILVSTVVSNALPRIISDLHAGESAPGTRSVIERDAETAADDRVSAAG